jgi:2-phospho-L-lactate guanylyltransferase
MNLFAVIPVKPFEEGKSRLREILTDTARRDFNREMFEHVLAVAVPVIGAGNTIVVSTDRTALELAGKWGVCAVREQMPTGLNAALKTGAASATARGADAILILPTDLPTLSQDDINALTSRANRSPLVVIAPDRRKKGTNALLIAPPDAIELTFGPNSFAAHQEHARAQQIEPIPVNRDGLAFDIDTPEDYRQLKRQGWEAARKLSGN